MTIASSCRMKEIDRRTIEEYGFSDIILMENAGIRILELGWKLTGFTKNTQLVCLAGGGNNGGDALVIARQLYSQGYKRINIIKVSEKGSAAQKTHLNICRNLGIQIIDFPDGEAGEVIQNAEIIFDGIAGTGISGALRNPLPELIELINSSRALRIAIDVPSGTGESFRAGFPAVKADYTLTVGLPLRCLYLPDVRPFCGEIYTVPIGFPEELKAEKQEPDGIECELITEDYIERLMPKLPGNSFKNRRGHLAVFGGSRGTIGAASLCAEAALRTSAGLVSLYSDADIYGIYASRHTSVMVKPLPEPEDLKNKMASWSAVAVGPGWGTEGREELLSVLLKEGRGVLDADGINTLAFMPGRSTIDLGGRWILTPHPGEFRKLFPDADIINRPYSEVVDAARLLNCVILLKGHVSYIADPAGRCAVLDGNYPKLGTAGSGDLLAGLIGGYAASGMEPFDAAVLGAALHLRGGRRCGAEHDWFSSEDLLEYL
ncbi:MAG: NAD(P)H-hydrate dehydratase [Spirochaetales bacterium]|nr:NAD(P)H-hydrate dehydratase [Spirochaetales bacterium]